MGRTLEPEMCERLLTADQPLGLVREALLWEELPADLADDVRREFYAAMAGSVTGARRLLRTWHAATSELAGSGADGLEISPARSALFAAKLAGLPRLATVYSEPLEGLYEWALVAVRELAGRPVAYPLREDLAAEDVLRFLQAVSAASVDELAPVARIKRTFAVSGEDVGRWLGVSAQSVSSYERGRTSPSPRIAGRLNRLVRLAETFGEVLEPAAIVPVFADRPVPLLGGLTYRQALDEQRFVVDVLVDVARRGAGRQPETVSGARYLASGRAARAVATVDDPAVREVAAGARPRDAGARRAEPPARLSVAARAAVTARGSDARPPAKGTTARRANGGGSEATGSATTGRPRRAAAGRLTRGGPRQAVGRPLAAGTSRTVPKRGSR